MWGPPSRPHVLTWPGSSAQSDLLYRAVLAPPKWMGQSPQGKTRSHSISGRRWTSGTPALLTSLVPTPRGSASLTAAPTVAVCRLPGPHSEELTTSRQPVLFSVLFSSQLEGSLFCDLPVCCPGTTPWQPGLQPVATRGSVFTWWHFNENS